MSPLIIIQIIAIALPLLLQLIKFVEEQVKASGILVPGPEKKASVLALFNQLWQTISPTDSKLAQIPADLLTNLLGPAIDSIVGIFNLVGIFTKSTKPA